MTEPDATVPAPLFVPGPDPFLGSTSGLSRQRLRGKRYLHLGRDVYAHDSSQVDLSLRLRAALLALPGAVPCGRTAALLQQLPVDDDGRLHLARGRRAPRSERAGVAVHRTPVTVEEQLLCDDILIADGPRVFLDLAADLGFEDLVAVGDVVLRRYGRDAIDRALARARRRPGVPSARRAAALLDGGAGSPAETRARLRLHAAGFPALRHGLVVRDAGGGWLAEPDLGDEVARVAVQHDGLVHLVGGPERRRKDLQRDEVVRQADWQVVVATALDDRRPELLIAKVADAYRRSALLLSARRPSGRTA